jgi:hypothetical protein
MPAQPMTWKEMADLLARGQKAFEGHRFYEAQMLWEAEALATSGDERGWLQGLATIASGLVAFDEHRVSAAERLLARGRWLLVTAPERVGAADVAGARAAAERVTVALQRGVPEDARQWVFPQ